MRTVLACASLIAVVFVAGYYLTPSRPVTTFNHFPSEPP